MKKILFVHHVSVVGGASYCLLSLLKEVDRQKYEPVVLLKDEGPLVEEIKALGIKVFFLSSLSIVPYNEAFCRLVTWSCYKGVLSSRKQFAEVLMQIKPAILYLNNSMLYPYLHIGKSLGIQTVIHIREHWPMDEHKVQLGWFQNGIRNHADRIVAINEYSAQMVPYAEGKTTIVYDWIDFADRYEKHDFNRLMGEDVSDKKVFLYTGGMQSIKGALEVFDAFSRVCGDDSRLLALGAKRNVDFSGWKGLVKRVLKLLGYKVKGIRMVEALNRDKRIVCVPSTYAIKDIIEQSYCVLSYFTIPHANLALAESIILKTPVISARTSESEEYTLKGKYAMLFEFKKIKEFEQKIANIDVMRPELKARLEEGSDIIAEKFDKKRNADIFRSVLNSII